MPTEIERARAYVRMAPVAVAGQGGHAATMKVARTLVSGFGLGHDDALCLLREYSHRCIPPWWDHDLQHKVRSAFMTPSPHPPGWMVRGSGFGIPCSSAMRDADRICSRPVPWSRSALERVAEGLVVTPRWLAQRSALNPREIGPSEYLAHIFDPLHKALVFTQQQSQGQALWPHESSPSTGPSGVWFMIQPVDGAFHLNPRQGSRSRRSEESVTEWRHMLLESDEAPRGLWLSAICRLPLPIVSIASSGNRSLHVLVRLGARTKAEWDEARRELLAPLSELGCDPAAMTAVRLARLPGCLRKDTGKLQTLYYLNAAPTAAPLAEIDAHTE